MYVMKAFGLSVDEALKWADTDLDFNVIKDWQEEGFTPEEAQRWNVLGLRPEVVKKLKAHGIDYDTFVKVLEKSLYSGLELCEILEEKGFDIKAVEQEMAFATEEQTKKRTIKP